MDARDQVAKGAMDQTVAGKMAKADKLRTGHANAEMGLAPLAPAAVTAMAFAFVDDFKPCRLQRRQAFLHLVSDHSDAPFMSREIA